MADTYMAVKAQIVGNPQEWSYEYDSDGEKFADRQAAIDHGWDLWGHDDFCIATVRDGRIAEYGWGMDDFSAEDRDDLAEIERQLGMGYRNEWRPA